MNKFFLPLHFNCFFCIPYLWVSISLTSLCDVSHNALCQGVHSCKFLTTSRFQFMCDARAKKNFNKKRFYVIILVLMLINIGKKRSSKTFFSNSNYNGYFKQINDGIHNMNLFFFILHFPFWLVLIFQVNLFEICLLWNKLSWQCSTFYNKN